ncbi:MAG: hypothetical protein LQ337_003109 [Flavoplaca oasis]|nr:MAG: hypothetical protein LQ337_003109 [Flavoplaca oasis]
MDLIEGIGQRYLMGKANAAPQQVENLVKKQFTGDAATASGKAGSAAAPNVVKDKEIEDLRKQLAEVKAAQNESAAPNVRKNKEMRKQLPEMKKAARMEKTATGSTGRRESIESVASRGRSKTPREPKKESHYPRPKKSEQRPPAAENVREMPKAKSSSSANAPIARPVTLPSYDMPGIRPNKHSIRVDRGKDSHGKAPTPAPVTSTPTHQRNITDRARLDSRSERPRPATDLCVVEVTEEEEPPTRRRERGGRLNVIEVVERRGNRTRYVVD